MTDLVSVWTLHRHMARFFHYRTQQHTGARLRDVRETAYHLYQAQEKDLLADTITSIPLFISLCHDESEWLIARYWHWLEAQGMNPGERCLRELKEWSNDADLAGRVEALALIAGLFQKIGRWSESVELQGQRIALAADADMRLEEASARTARGWIFHAQGRWKDAIADLEKAADLFVELQYDRGFSQATGNTGLVYFTLGQYDRAMEFFERMLATAERLHDLRSLSDVYGNIGLIYLDKGEHDKAIECYQRKFDCAASLGDQRSMSWAVANMGIAHLQRGDCDRALASFRQHRAMCEEIGDLMGIGYATGNTGNAHFARNELDEALECYQRWRDIMQSLGDRRGASIAIGNIGLVHARRYEFQEALTCYQESHRLSSEIGERLGACRARGNIGFVFLDQEAHALAVDAFRDAIVGYEDLGLTSGSAGWMDGMGRALIAMITDIRQHWNECDSLWPDATPETWRDHCLHEARQCLEERMRILPNSEDEANTFLIACISAIEGNTEAARDRFEWLLLNAQDDEQRADLHYWLWRIEENREDSDSGVHRKEALRLYAALERSTRKPPPVSRINELSVTRKP